MIQLKISGKDPAKTETHVRSLGKACHDLKAQHPSVYRTVEILGPIEASLTRIAQFYRWQIILKSLHTKALHDFTGRLLAEHAPRFGRRDVKVIIDVDPYFMM
jgi:primosomal protein N' (replication factor Y)